MDSTSLHAALQAFADAVTTKMTQVTAGEPEDQLRGPFETFLAAAAQTWGWAAVCAGETRLPDRIGRPDYAVHLNELLAGYVDLKAPGVGANAKRFRGHNRDQFKRFSAIPNILYTDGNEWALYRNGQLVDQIVRLSGDVATDGCTAATLQDAHAVERLLRDFLSWQPFIPTDRQGKLDLKGFAELLAPLCRLLRDDVTDTLKNQTSPLVQLARDWRQSLFPDASNEQFADVYAQTVTFALLLARGESDDPLTLDSAQNTLIAQHGLLSRALRVLTDPDARTEITASLDLLLRVIAVVPPTDLSGSQDPWLYFYEYFLAIYDPELRKNAGVYYTPVEVVHAQTRLIDDLLVNRLNKPLGFADPGVVTLDPAVGTGTYLLGVIEHALARIEVEQGAGAVAGQATELAKNLYGFELMVGAYAVSELRVSRALSDRGATLPDGGMHVYLTDTLESPNTELPSLSFALKLIGEQHAKAQRVKSEVPVIVCLGNPPYDRHPAVDWKTEDNLSPYGGWVRFGDPLADNIVKDKRGKSRELKTAKARLKRRQQLAILRNFVDPVKEAGHGGHLKNLYNLYVYFWRWALWKVFEQKPASGPGVVSFITASSYLYGNAFVGIREHLRRHCDEIWILDLGGEGRGPRRSDNVFAIQTPVAIAVAMRTEEAKQDTPAMVHYFRIEGTHDEKLATLDSITRFSAVAWQDCPADWQAPFLPAGRGMYFGWPLLTDLMPWQHSGVQLKRTWPIAPDVENLEQRWRGLLNAENRSEAFHGTGDREVHGTYHIALTEVNDSTPISDLPSDTSMPEVQRYAHRSFDRRYIIADGRLISRPRPELWRAHGEHQMYVTSLLTSSPLGAGPALTACATIPDLHHFRGSYGAKDTIPLYRTPDTSETNILPCLLEILGAAYQRTVTPEDFLAYVYGVLAQPAFTESFAAELETQELRAPITKDAALFEQVCAIGARLLWLHTYGERFVPEGEQHGRVPSGVARCTNAIPGDIADYPETFSYIDTTRALHIGEGVFAPVAPEVYEFEVSGLKVVQSWLNYRMRNGAGRKSSPLDDIRPVRWTSTFTTELLELLWVLEATVAIYPEQERLLKTVVESACFQTDDLPPVPDGRREQPRARASADDLFDLNE